MAAVAEDKDQDRGLLLAGLVAFVVVVLCILGFVAFMWWRGQMPAALRADVITKVADSSSKVYSNLPSNLRYLNAGGGNKLDVSAINIT